MDVATYAKHYIKCTTSLKSCIYTLLNPTLLQVTYLQVTTSNFLKNLLAEILVNDKMNWLIKICPVKHNSLPKNCSYI